MIKDYALMGKKQNLPNHDYFCIYFAFRALFVSLTLLEPYFSRMVYSLSDLNSAPSLASIMMYTLSVALSRRKTRREYIEGARRLLSKVKHRLNKHSPKLCTGVRIRSKKKNKFEQKYNLKQTWSNWRKTFLEFRWFTLRETTEKATANNLNF